MKRSAPGSSHWGRGHPLSLQVLDTHPTWWYPGSTMNKTETLAYEWLQKNQEYSPSDIIFRVGDSPDFITADGKGWEVKLVRGWQVVFTRGQVSRLRAHPDVTLLLWVDGQLQNAKPFEELEVPGRWGKYNFHVLDSTNIKVPDDVHRRLVEYADGRPLGMAIIRLLDILQDAAPTHAQIEFRPAKTAQAKRAATALREQTAMQERMSEGWQKIPEHEHPQLSSEPADPPLDAEGIPADSPKGKATPRTRPYRIGGGSLRFLKPTCTCGPGERAKGKHNRHCPAKGA